MKLYLLNCRVPEIKIHAGEKQDKYNMRICIKNKGSI